MATGGAGPGGHILDYGGSISSHINQMGTMLRTAYWQNCNDIKYLWELLQSCYDIAFSIVYMMQTTEKSAVKKDVLQKIKSTLSTQVKARIERLSKNPQDRENAIVLQHTIRLILHTYNHFLSPIGDQLMPSETGFTNQRAIDIKAINPPSMMPGSAQTMLTSSFRNTSNLAGSPQRLPSTQSLPQRPKTMYVPEGPPSLPARPLNIQPLSPRPQQYASQQPPELPTSPRPSDLQLLSPLPQHDIDLPQSGSKSSKKKSKTSRGFVSRLFGFGKKTPSTSSMESAAPSPRPEISAPIADSFSVGRGSSLPISRASPRASPVPSPGRGSLTLPRGASPISSPGRGSLTLPRGASPKSSSGRSPGRSPEASLRTSPGRRSPGRSPLLQTRSEHIYDTIDSPLVQRRSPSFQRLDRPQPIYEAIGSPSRASPRRSSLSLSPNIPKEYAPPIPSMTGSPRASLGRSPVGSPRPSPRRSPSLRTPTRPEHIYETMGSPGRASLRRSALLQSPNMPNEFAPPIPSMLGSPRTSLGRSPIASPRASPRRSPSLQTHTRSEPIYETMGSPARASQRRSALLHSPNMPTECAPPIPGSPRLSGRTSSNTPPRRSNLAATGAAPRHENPYDLVYQGTGRSPTGRPVSDIYTTVKRRDRSGTNLKSRAKTQLFSVPSNHELLDVVLAGDIAKFKRVSKENLLDRPDPPPQWLPEDSPRSSPRSSPRASPRISPRVSPRAPQGASPRASQYDPSLIYETPQGPIFLDSTSYYPLTTPVSQSPSRRPISDIFVTPRTLGFDPYSIYDTPRTGGPPDQDEPLYANESVYDRIRISATTGNPIPAPRPDLCPGLALDDETYQAMAIEETNRWIEKQREKILKRK